MSKTSFKPSGRVARIIRWMNLVAIALTLLAYCSPMVSPEKFWLFHLIGLMYPWLLLFHLLFVAFWISIKRWNFLLSLICVLFGWGYFISFIGIGFPAKADKNTLKVMSLNTNSFFYFSKKPKPENLAKFYEIVKKEAPDVICFQEYTENTARAAVFLDSLKRYIPLKDYYFSRNKLQLTVSKFPILEKGDLSFPNTSNGSIYVDVAVNGRRARIYNLHLQSNKITYQTNKLADDADFQEKETWVEVGSILKKMRIASKFRAQQAEKIAAHIRQCKYPVVAAGDFNDTPLSYTYAVLSEGMKDTFKEKGNGLATTYAGAIPALRIDYILTSPALKTLKFQTIHRKVSDHYAITATLSFD